ncbi:Peptidogalycan biosysnthesis/recognition [Pseudomonas sp. NFACC48-1]|nr:Peptidogalycan biosysnthesis/recognition [Pseudomonas sp. NFACC44-2]SDA87565.1 Peptidogalycan biosysnthesis/recognition [Pseudomonas sp. NFACC51]SFH86468.1 Peptidogalycan biosysnthesis/recognition [Pseudomonas sp. NFACC54]SFS49235.1 Peptidogalycan biosysnthesis/recognition [Pseudomonas sp. NFACC48-1]
MLWRYCPFRRLHSGEPHAAPRFNSLSSLAPPEWDTLVPANQPFLRHAFLSTLEDSASLDPQSGWQPERLLHIDGGRLLAALPSCRKWHSYGEYLFDHAWADACVRARTDYYPRLLMAVPFSPVTGPRLLAARGEDGLELLGSLPGYREQVAGQGIAFEWLEGHQLDEAQWDLSTPVTPTPMRYDGRRLT